jgi:N-carbamoyl-L-amino-acid hydrolase
MQGLHIDADRLTAELEELARFSDAPAPAVTRVVYTEADQQARRWFLALCEEEGLTLRADAIGNLFARWQGSDPAAPAVATGSHIDAIPHSGRYDGTVGVIGGLEAIRALRRAGHRPVRSIELVLLASEEPTRFGIGCFGSRALAGAITPAALAALRDPDGITLDEARRAAGYTGPIEGVALPRGHYQAWVELHIEQGPRLEAAGLDIGAVTAIAAPATLRVVVEGEGGHAGACLMPDRRDALCAAAEMVLAAESIARGTGAPDSVATVGILDIHPRAVNSIPLRTEFTVDVRDIDGPRRDAMLEALRARIDSIAKARGVAAHVAVLNADPPAACDPRVVAAIESAAAASGASCTRLVSRAYHDSLFMARVAPTAMIFIPCRGGVSHRPDEYSSPEQIRHGVEVLARTLAGLSGSAV